MRNLLLSACLIAFFNITSTAQEWDWSGHEVLAYPGEGNKWELQEEVSTDFNYSSKSDIRFSTGFRDTYINGWRGSGSGVWLADHSEIADSMLVLRSSLLESDPDPKKRIGTGVVTSKEPIMFPVYTEVSMKPNSLLLPTSFWFLSADDTREIDATECIGSYHTSMNTNYHIFERDPNTNAIIKDYGHIGQQHHTPGKTLMKDNFHRIGMYWIDAEHIEFYLDGKLVRELNSGNDLNSFQGEYIDRPLLMILNVQEYDWLLNQDKTPSDDELADSNLNRAYFDWIRVYKPVVSGDGDDVISSDSIPEEIVTDSVYNFKVPYSASENRDIAVKIYRNGVLLGSGKTTVTAGSGIADVKVTLPGGSATVAKNYLLITSIRPTNTNWEENIQVSHASLDVIKAPEEPPTAILYSKQSEISIYPNPSSDYINIKGLEDSMGILRYEIMSVNGIKIKEGILSSSVIDVSYIDRGNYILKLLSSDKINIQKVIIE